MFLFLKTDDLHELGKIIIVVCNFHALSSKDIGRTNQHRIAQLVGRFQRLFKGEDGKALGSWNA